MPQRNNPVFYSCKFTAQETQCRAILAALVLEIPKFYDKKDRANGGIQTKDRQGNKVFNPFVTMSIGAVGFDGVPSMTTLIFQLAFANRKTSKSHRRK